MAMKFRLSEGPIIALTLIGAGIALPLSAHAQGVRNWHAGAVSLAAPETWQPPVVAGPGLAPLDLSGDDWNVALTDHPRAPDAGAMLVLHWSNDIPEEGEWPAAFHRARTVFSGHDALRVDWTDTEMGWTGFEIVIADPGVGGKRFSLTCRSPSRNWSVVSPLCERVAASVQLLEPSPPVSATPPAASWSGVTDSKPSTVAPPATWIPAQSAPGPGWFAGLIDPPTWSMAVLVAVSAGIGVAIAGLAVFLVGRSRKGSVSVPKLPPAVEAVRSPAAPARIEVSRFCTQCGAKVVASGPCPKCGALE
jgi:hypothetical protein